MDVKKKKFLYLGHLENWEVDLNNYMPTDFLKIWVKSTVCSRFMIALS